MNTTVNRGINKFKLNTMYAKKCDCCAEGMNAGYVDVDKYYCSDRCLIWGNTEDGIPQSADEPIIYYDMDMWELDHQREPESCYYTEWEIEEVDGEEAYDEEGNLCVYSGTHQNWLLQF